MAHTGENPLSRQLSEDRFAPLTSDDQTRIIRDLAQAIADCDNKAEQRIRHELIERHLRLVLSLTKGYEKRLDQEEAFAVGVLALSEAMQRWNPAPGGMSPYQWAKRWITTALNKAVDAARTIRIPSQVAYSAALNTRTVKETEARLGRRLSAEEIETLTNGERRLEDLPLADVSLDAPPPGYAKEDDAATLAEVTASTDRPIEDEITRDDLHARVRRSLRALTDQERLVIEHRFGLNGAEGRTLAELGKMLGTSGEAIRRLEASALAKLTHPANPDDLGGML
jgi:RNA polymerase primary sigma factor